MNARLAAFALVAALALGTGAAEAQDQDPDTLPESPFKERLQEQQTIQERLLRAINERLDEEIAELHERIADLQVQIFELVQAKPEFAPWYDTDPERFELWTDCQPMVMSVFVSDRTEGGARLTEESVRSAVESRLRAARLYSDGTDSVWLKVSVFRGEHTYYTAISLLKERFDFRTGLRGASTTWDTWATGRGSADYVRSSIAELMDTFLAAYLRVNDKACG